MLYWDAFKLLLLLLLLLLVVVVRGWAAHRLVMPADPLMCRIG